MFTPIEMEMVAIFRQLDEEQQQNILRDCRGRRQVLWNKAEGLKPTPAHRAHDDKGFQAFMARCRESD